MSADPVASLGLVSPGAATDGVTPIFTPFFRKKTHDHFSHRRLQSHDLFYPVRPHLSTVLSVLSYFSHNFFHSGVTLLKGKGPGDTRSPPPPPPLVTLLS